MEHRSVILMFAIMSFMGWYGCSFSMKKTIKDVGFHKKYYPQRYVMPNRLIRKLYKLDKREIPKWINCELLMSFIYILWFIISVLVYLLSNDKLSSLQLFIWIYGIFACADSLYVTIFLFLYR